MSEKMTGGFDDFENVLKSLQPASQLHRDEVLFRAGQASARHGWRWPTSTLAMMAVAAVLGVMLLQRPEPHMVERIVYVNVPPPVQIAVAPVEDKQTPEPIRVEPPISAPINMAQLTVGSIWQMPLDDWRWRPEHQAEASSNSETSISEPPTLMNLMNAWNNEKYEKKRIR